MFSKQIINNLRYINTIQSNGSVFFIFDYNSDDFKVNEIFFLNFSLIETQCLLKLNNQYYFFFNFKTHYFNTLHKEYLTYNNLKYIYDDKYEVEKQYFFKNKKVLIKEKIDNHFFEKTFFKDKYFDFYNEIYTYNNFEILKLLKFFSKKLFFNIFFNI